VTDHLLSDEDGEESTISSSKKAASRYINRYNYSHHNDIFLKEARYYYD
jgi:hypothetical protein